MRVFAGPDELRGATGSRLGQSDWMTVEQSQIDSFAAATGDHQWIHVDAERAKDGAFGATIAHGFLTLSLIPVLVAQVARIDNVKMTINYGLNKVRFISPVRVGSRIRGTIELLEVADLSGGVQVTNRVTVEVAGSDRPALVAETLLRHYW